MCAAVKLKAKQNQTTGKVNRVVESEDAGCRCYLRGAAVKQLTMEVEEPQK